MKIKDHLLELPSYIQLLTTILHKLPKATMATNLAFRPQSQPLSFPAQTFAKLSPLPFLEAHLNCDPPTRPSGRHPTQARTPTSHSSSLTHASGSAVVRIGSTSVVCGVRAEILYVRDIADYTARNIPPPNDSKKNTQEEEEGEDDGGNSGKVRDRRREDADEMARLNLVVPNIELATGCSPAHLPGGPPSSLAQTLTQRTLTLLHTTQLLNLSDLRIWHSPNPTTSTFASSEDVIMDFSPNDSSDPAPPKNVKDNNDDAAPVVKAFWTLYIDIVFISLDGNPFDAAWSSLLAALLDTKLPQATYDIDTNTILCSPLTSLAHPLHLRSLPIPLSFGVFPTSSSSSSSSSASTSKSKETIILVDMDAFEEDICVERGTVVVSGNNGVVVGVEKIGGGMVRGRELRMLVELAGGRWREWRGVLGG